MLLVVICLVLGQSGFFCKTAFHPRKKREVSMWERTSGPRWPPVGSPGRRPEAGSHIQMSKLQSDLGESVQSARTATPPGGFATTQLSFLRRKASRRTERSSANQRTRSGRNHCYQQLH